MKSLEELEQELERLEDLYDAEEEDYKAVMQFADDLEEERDGSKDWNKLYKDFKKFKKKHDLDDGYDEGDMLNMMYPNG